MSHRVPQRRSRYRPLLAAGATRLAVYPVGAMAAVATAALVIHAYGPAAYGVYTLIASFAALLTFCDFGIGSALSTRLARNPSAPVGDLVVLIAATLRWMLAIACGLMVLDVVLLLSGAFRSVLGGASDAEAHAELGLFFCILTFVIAMPLGVGQRLLIGLGRPTMWSALQVAIPVGTFAWCLVVRFSDGPAWLITPGPAVGMLIAALLSSIVAFAGLRPDVTFGRIVRSVCRKGSARVWSAARPMFMILVANAVAVQSDRLVLSHTGHTGALAAYGLCAQFFAPVGAALSASAFALWGLVGSGRYRRRTPFIATAGFAVAASAGCGVIALVFRPLASIISGSTIMPSDALIGWSGATVVVTSAQFAVGSFLLAPADLTFQAKCVALMLPANLVLSVILAFSVGAVGPLVATVATVLVFQTSPALLRLRSSPGNGGHLTHETGDIAEVGRGNLSAEGI